MEDELFLKKMKGVSPLKNKKNFVKKLNKQEKINLSPDKKIQTKNLQSTIKPTIIKKSEFNIEFGDINKDLKKGRVSIDRRVDLHGYTLSAAEKKFKTEVIKNYNKNKRCLLIITGKGVHTNKNNNEGFENTSPKLFYGKIKNNIISWIKESDIKNYILTYQDAGLEHGGDGALFIYLRKKKIKSF